MDALNSQRCEGLDTQPTPAYSTCHAHILRKIWHLS